MQMTTDKSHSLYSRARDFTTEGVQHASRFGLPHPTYFDRAEGAHIFDVDGHEYIDYVMGSGPLILGHRHPKVIEAVIQQLRKTQLLGGSSESEIELCFRINQSVPGAEVVRLLPTGNDATTLAIRLARALSGRDLVVKCEGGFHGTSEAFLPGLDSATASDGRVYGALEAGLAATRVVPFGDLEAAEHLFRSEGNRIAAFILEPVFRSVILPPTGYLEGLRYLCSKYGALLIFDEVGTGFRFLYGSAAQLLRVTPDLFAFGKIIGGGFPIGAIAGRREILSMLSPTYSGEQKIWVGSTWYGHPVATAAGVATLDILAQPGQYRRLNELGSALRHGLSEVFKRRAVPIQVVGFGPCLKIVFAPAPVTDWRSSLPVVEMSAIRAFKAETARLGVLFAGPAHLPGLGKYISLAHREQDIERTVAAVDEALASMTIGRKVGRESTTQA